MTEEWSLDTLPTDVLLFIFNYSTVPDLVRLSGVCKRFNEIISDDALWIRRSNRPLVTNQSSKKFRERCNPLLCLRKKWQISNNWICGRYDKTIIRAEKVNTIPWIQLTEDILWWSGSNRLCGFRRGTTPRQRRFRDRNNSNCIFHWDNIQSDITRFIVRDDYIVSGHFDGSISFWLKSARPEGHFNAQIPNAHVGSVFAIDHIPQAIITGAADGSVKVWLQEDDIYDIHVTASFKVYDKIRSLAVDAVKGKIAVGSTGTTGEPPLHIFDLERCKLLGRIDHVWRHGAGILDMIWEDPQCLLTCGYDTYIRKWDMRTGTCVRSWADPTDATLYCISTDFRHTMVTGTQYNSKVVLWDQRQPKYIQFYFLNTRSTSPVYSVSFDSSHLYGAIDRQLIEFKFSGNNKFQKDYRGIL